ncbi:MAG TPA: tRNA (guanosine(37)-N1)-methyltransferase TrmD [Thermoleophilia bacterium]|nr:tRNA (guanosine(37)-N1)-methyltransferase TrmD [Thermoleophilia bacterium]
MTRRFDVFTLVPEAFGWFRAQHPVRDALDSGAVDLRVHNIRDYTSLRHNAVDDTPYGGGPGMVIRVDVVAEALEGVFGVPAERVKEDREVFVLSPAGRPFDDREATLLAESERDLVLLSGRYEGFDYRVVELFASAELSVGPFVLAGGEVATMAVLEATIRKMPGVLGNEQSLLEESFSVGLAGAGEYPQFTRPREFRGSAVPEILLSGNHGSIAEWRRQQARASGWSAWCPASAAAGDTGKRQAGLPEG